jgi:hypothetical protein
LSQRQAWISQPLPVTFLSSSLAAGLSGGGFRLCFLVFSELEGSSGIDQVLVAYHMRVGDNLKGQAVILRTADQDIPRVVPAIREYWVPQRAR